MTKGLVGTRGKRGGGGGVDDILKIYFLYV